MVSEDGETEQVCEIDDCMFAIPDDYTVLNDDTDEQRQSRPSPTARTSTLHHSLIITKIVDITVRIS